MAGLMGLETDQSFNISFREILLISIVVDLLFFANNRRTTRVILQISFVILPQNDDDVRRNIQCPTMFDTAFPR